MKTGAAISGGVHLAFLAIALFGLDWFSDRVDDPLNVTEIEFIDGTDFDALVSAAPTVPTDKPSELSRPGKGDPAPERPETPNDTAEPADAPVLTDAPEPDKRPEKPEIAFNTPTDIPTEAPKPSIAVIASPDPLNRESAEPESPASTEPVAPLAAMEAPTPEKRPTKPPDPEPEPTEPEKAKVTAPSEDAEDTRKPDPEPEKETDPESVAETSPDAPKGPAPVEARLPLAKPADLAAAAEAARRAEEERIAREIAEKEREKTAAAPEPEKEKPEKPARTERTAASNTRRGPPLNASEKNALRVGIQKHYYYSGDTSDRSLRVKVVIDLSKAGEIVGKPRVVDAGTSVQRALGRAGARALMKAASAGEFKRLPPDKYNRWKRLNVIFTVDQAAVSG